MKNKGYLLTLVIVLVLLAVVFVYYNNNNKQTQTDLINKNSEINTNISNVKCDGSENFLSIDSGYALMRLGISDKNKQMITNLKESGLIINLYPMSLPSNLGERIFNESYYDVLSSLLESGGHTGTNFSPDTVEFLTIVNDTNVNPIQEKMKTWQVEYEADTIFINPPSDTPDNKPRLIYYGCNIQ